MENEIPGIRDMSVREVEKNTKNFLTQNYLEPIQYVLKTQNIFPYDFYDDKPRAPDT